MNAFPFDSRIIGYEDDGMPIYDRASNAEEFARLLAAFLRDGVFNESMCVVTENGDMTATISSGNMLIQGRYGYIDEGEIVVFEASDTSNPRIDTVVLRRDLSADVNNIVAAVVKGVAAAAPVAPSLTRDGTVWELGIADVYRAANSSVITQENITDTRLDEERCGIVAAILTDIETETFALQYNALLQKLKDMLQDAYDGAVPRDPGVLRIDEEMSLTETEKGNVYTSLGLDAESLGGMQTELVWENASPTSTFGAQSINLNIDPSDVFCIETSVGTTGAEQFFIIRASGRALLNAAYVYGNATYSLYTRPVSFSAQNGLVSFNDARHVFYENGTNIGTDNKSFIPARIYKVTGVF